MALFFWYKLLLKKHFFSAVFLIADFATYLISNINGIAIKPYL